MQDLLYVVHPPTTTRVRVSRRGGGAVYLCLPIDFNILAF